MSGREASRLAATQCCDCVLCVPAACFSVSVIIPQRPASAPTLQREAWGEEAGKDEGRDRDEEWIPREEAGAADQMHTGPSQTGEVAGEEITFVGMNKAIENRVCINLRRMSWAEPPRTIFLVERSDGWRTVGSEGRRLDHKCYLAVESICRYCKEHLGLDILVEGRCARERERESTRGIAGERERGRAALERQTDRQTEG